MVGTEESVAWLHYADNSYLATRVLWFTGLQFDSVICSHRAVELYLKAFLVGKGVEVKPGSPAWGHVLSALGKAALAFDPAFAQEAVTRRLWYFERYFDYSRYPSVAAAPPDGSMTWFAFEANIAPLDELVAFIRPRIPLGAQEWRDSRIHDVRRGLGRNAYQHRALVDCNKHLAFIDCTSSGEPQVAFDVAFHFDKPGC